MLTIPLPVEQNVGVAKFIVSILLAVELQVQVGKLLSVRQKPNEFTHWIGSTGIIQGGKKIDTLPPCGIPAQSCKLIASIDCMVIQLLVEVIDIACISPGIVLCITMPVSSQAILQLAQLLLVMAVVQIKVILKLDELPKNVGFPMPASRRIKQPLGLGLAGTCKLKMSIDVAWVGRIFCILLQNVNDVIILE